MKTVLKFGVCGGPNDSNFIASELKKSLQT